MQIAFRSPDLCTDRFIRWKVYAPRVPIAGTEPEAFISSLRAQAVPNRRRFGGDVGIPSTGSIDSSGGPDDRRSRCRGSARSMRGGVWHDVSAPPPRVPDQPMPAHPPFMPDGDPAEILTAILESSEDAIIGERVDGIIASWNRGAERLFGYSAAEIVGQSA